MKTILPIGKVVFLYPKSNQDTQGRTGNRLPLCHITRPRRWFIRLNPYS